MSLSSATKAKRLVVLGGGVSGLSFVHYLRVFASAANKEHLLNRITLIEANDYLGGSIKSKVHNDGVVHELGPRFIRSQGVKANSTMALAEHLGLDKDAIVLNGRTAKRRQVYLPDGKIEFIPHSFLNLFSKLPGTSTTLFRAIIRDLYKAPKMNLEPYPDQDPPLYDFFAHRFGEEIAEALLDPVMRGINAADCRKLSTRALVADMIDKEQVYGSVIKGLMKPPLKKTPHDELYVDDVLNSKFVRRNEKEKIVSYSFTSGLEQLAQRLANSLLNYNPDNKVSIYNQTKAISVNFDTEEEDHPSVIVQVPNGDTVKIDADHIISALPSSNFGRLLKESLPSNRRTIWDNITNVPHNPVASVVVEFHNSKLRERKDLQSAGVLAHSKSDSKALAISYDNMLFPDTNPDVFKVNVMIGGEWFNQVLGTTDVDSITTGKLEEIALGEIRRIVNITDEPKRMTTHLWKTGIPQYRPGHKEMVDATRCNVKRLGIPLTLIGQSYDGIAINDVVFGARMAANDFINNLSDISV